MGTDVKLVSHQGRNYRYPQDVRITSGQTILLSILHSAFLGLSCVINNLYIMAVIKLLFFYFSNRFIHTFLKFYLQQIFAMSTFCQHFVTMLLTFSLISLK